MEETDSFDLDKLFVDENSDGHMEPSNLPSENLPEMVKNLKENLQSGMKESDNLFEELNSTIDILDREIRSLEKEKLDLSDSFGEFREKYMKDIMELQSKNTDLKSVLADKEVQLKELNDVTTEQGHNLEVVERIKEIVVPQDEEMVSAFKETLQEATKDYELRILELEKSKADLQKDYDDLRTD